MNRKAAVESTSQTRGAEPRKPDCNALEQTPKTGVPVDTPPKETSSPNKILDCLLFRHSVELGAIAWISCIAAILNVIWAIQGFNTTNAASQASLTQTTLANQISFLKLCLEYPQLGLKSSSSRRLEPLLQKVPCDDFLRALDFDAVTQALVYPKLISEVKSAPPQDDLYIASDFDHWRDVNTISQALTSRKLAPDAKATLQRKDRDKSNDSNHDDEFGLNKDSVKGGQRSSSGSSFGGTLLKYTFVAVLLWVPFKYLGFAPALGPSVPASEPTSESTAKPEKVAETRDLDSDSDSDSDFEE